MRIVLVLVAVAACTPGPDIACDRSLLHGDSGWTLASPAGTTFRPTVVFGNADDGAHPDTCHYARNQGDEVCTEPGGWVDNNSGERSGTLTITPFQHACGGFVVGSTYELMYSFDKVQGFLWIDFWSNNQ